MVFRFVLMRLSCFAGWTFFFIKTIIMAWKTLWQDVLDLIYPPLCPACNHDLRPAGLMTCLRCFSQLPWFSNCDLKDNPITDRLAGRLLLSDGFALLYFVKEGLSQQLIHQIKYKGDRTTALTVGQWLGQQLVKDLKTACPWDIIVPVPLHKRKLRRRGFNQSEVFGAGLAEVLGIPLAADVLHRPRAGQSQASQGQESRFATVFQTFELQRPELIRGKHVLLVDDVLTTGATLESCGHLLQQHGAAALSLGVIAVTQI